MIWLLQCYLWIEVILTLVKICVQIFILFIHLILKTIINLQFLSVSITYAICFLPALWWSFRVICINGHILNYLLSFIFKTFLSKQFPVLCRYLLLTLSTRRKSLIKHNLCFIMSGTTWRLLITIKTYSVTKRTS